MDDLPKGFILEKTIYVGMFDARNVIKLGPLDGKYVAIKQGPNLKREIDMLKKIGSHPNIVEFISEVERGFVMTGIKDGYNLHDYCFDGKTRNPQLREAKLPFSIKTCVSMISQIAQALNYLHKLDIIHHDLKDKNVLVDETVTKDPLNENLLVSSYHLKLCDFEFSEVVDEEGRGKEETRTSGTSAWMALEQKDPEVKLPVTTKIDVYAFGCLCVEILTFRRTSKELIQQCKPPMIYDLAFACQSNHPDKRPDIKEVAEIFGVLDEDGVLEQMKDFNKTIGWESNL